MNKKFWLKTGITLSALFILSFTVYLFFPHVWGDILYPLDYDAYIIKYSKDYNLDPALVSGVIYTESRFNKDSVSRVGARGLMQIMPSTGRSIASKLGESFNADNLFDPETNIRYGCWYLNYLFGNYPDNQNAVLAGYNGGGAIGDRYIVSREAGLPRETQGFIKTVNSAQEMYKKLYSDKLNINISAENIAEKMRLQKEKQETWYDKMIRKVLSLTKST